MKRLIALVVLWGGVNSSIAQSYDYLFKVNAVTSYGMAKQMIPVLRDILGVRTIYFDDASDQFKIKCQHNFDVEEMKNKLYLNEVEVEGSITKTING